MYFKKKEMSKRGISTYLSWVIIIAFVVGLSAFMYSFMTGYTESQAEKIKERAISATECDSVAVSIDYVCQNTQNLYINITNRGNIKVDEFIFRIYDLYYEPQIDEKNVSLLIGKYNAKEVKLVKRGAVKKVRKIEIVPIVISENIRVICENRMSYYPIGDEMVADCLDR